MAEDYTTVRGSVGSSHRSTRCIMTNKMVPTIQALGSYCPRFRHPSFRRKRFYYG
jgi:hypothetical protein